MSTESLTGCKYNNVNCTECCECETNCNKTDITDLPCLIDENYECRCVEIGEYPSIRSAHDQQDIQILYSDSGSDK
jgi:hypothetical protein